MSDTKIINFKGFKRTLQCNTEYFYSVALFFKTRTEYSLTLRSYLYVKYSILVNVLLYNLAYASSAHVLPTCPDLKSCSLFSQAACSLSELGPDR